MAVCVHPQVLERLWEGLAVSMNAERGGALVVEPEPMSARLTLVCGETLFFGPDADGPWWFELDTGPGRRLAAASCQAVVLGAQRLSQPAAQTEVSFARC